VSATERLGQAHSPLTVEELLETLDDPRFNVRFEAIISIARHGPDDRLIDALAKTLHHSEPALGVVAAWALGRLGDPKALEILREGLDAPYRSIRAHCARALGTIGDESVIPILLETLNTETDFGLLTAYGSALGKLRVAAALPKLLSLLAQCPDQEAQKTIALSVGRIVGDEYSFIQLLRQAGSADPGTAIAQALTTLKSELGNLNENETRLLELFDATAESFAQGDIHQGVTQVQETLSAFPKDGFDDVCRTILAACRTQMDQHGAERLEYVVLALHTIRVGQCV